MTIREWVLRLRHFAWRSDGSVGTRVLRSGVLLGAASAITAAVSVVRSIVLARLLSPEIFGLMGLAGVAIRTIEAITRPGVAQALIAGDNRFDEAASTAFTLLVLRGLLLSLLLVTAAPFVAKFYDSPQIEPMLQALSAVFLISGISNINVVARQKALDFRHVMIMDLTAWILGATITIALAWWLRSVWALVIGQIATSAVTAILSYTFIPGRPTFDWNPAVARQLLGYGKFITGSSLAMFIATEIDSAVVGKVLGMEELGLYTLAFTIANLVTANLAKVAASVVMPAYSQLKNDVAALRRAYSRTFELTMLIVLPATAGLMLVAEPMIKVLYGEQWLPAARPLQVLCVFGLLRALVAFSGYLFEGIGHPKIAFQLALLRVAIIVPAIVALTTKYSLFGTAVTVTAGMGAAWILGLVFTKRHLGVGIGAIAVWCWRPAWTTAAMSLGVWVVSKALDPHSGLGLAVAVSVGVSIYCALNWTVWKRQRVRTT